MTSKHSSNFVNMTKSDKYQELYKTIESVISGESDQIANMANTAALLHEAFGFWWTGFYIIKGEQLVLGPFQGPVACTRIGFGKGVCGTSWERRETIVVPDVHQFPGHIACSSLSQSEIVVPIFHNNEIHAVLDIDSKELATFDEVDKEWLEKIVTLL
jgi:GAF domain-containing protein